MAIRARIKSKIKSLLFGTSSTTQSEPVSPVPTPQSFTPPTVSTAASTTSTVSEQKNASETSVDSPTPTTSVKKSDTQTINEEHNAGKQETLDSTSKAPSEEPAELDAKNASFIIEITDLFPEACPHCEASSHNNWIRIENKFACGSCETAY